MVFRQVLAASSLLIVLGIVGCGDGAPSVKTVPVSGTVTYNGNPIEGATVTFMQQAEGIRPAGGQTDAQGKFMLKTALGGTKMQDGAMEGSFVVTITKSGGNTLPTGSPALGTDPGSISEAEKKAMFAKMTAGPSQEEVQKDPAVQQKEIAEKAKSKLPEKYAGAKTTPLKETVKAGDKNEFTFVLSDD